MPRPQLSFSRTRAAAWGALAAAALAPGRASAVVNQIDGTVVPVLTPANCAGAADKCVQTALNIGEGLPANAQNNPLNAIFDAATTPEVFTIPQTNGVFGQVTFRDLQEGAGYENTFGWYNVNDPTQLYPVILCAEEAGTIKVVDFQQEFLQGRYQGGFIGFFLITPEGTASNCGSLSNVGYLYYTEAARNGDGNYVHYLIYSSEVNPLSYYFAFEDLFRGGDNDFDDMALQVTGLLKPCTPSAEICDGMDNNCDGLIDNMPVDAGGPCGLPDIGVCEDGTLSCQGGSLVCVGAVSPAPEICDGLDNDCDGMVDDMPVDAGGPCGSDVGECDLGVQTCVGGVLVCVGGSGPSPEVCNTLDDDCDGMVDEDTVDAGGPCGSNVGVCEPGTLTCQGGQIVCVGGTQGTPEVCNNLDDDCNGAIDDGNPGGGGPCGSDVGICSPGVEYCIGGVIACVGGTPPGEEICDGLDNDCDGMGDDMAPCPGASVCLDGACTAPCGDGEFPCPGGQICVGGYCVPESCDNINCPPGQTCVSGICVDSGAGGSGTGGGGQGGAGGSGTGGAPTGGTGTGGPADNWGLATGGGGALCAARPGASPAGGGAGVAALALTIALAARRRRSLRKGGAR